MRNKQKNIEKTNFYCYLESHCLIEQYPDPSKCHGSGKLRRILTFWSSQSHCIIFTDPDTDLSICSCKCRYQKKVEWKNYVRLRIRNLVVRVHGSETVETFRFLVIPYSGLLCWWIMRFFCLLVCASHARSFRFLFCLLVPYRYCIGFDEVCYHFFQVFFLPLDPGSGMGKNPYPGFGIRDEHPGSYFWKLRISFLG